MMKKILLLIFQKVITNILINKYNYEDINNKINKFICIIIYFNLNLN